MRWIHLQGRRKKEQGGSRFPCHCAQIFVAGSALQSKPGGIHNRHPADSSPVEAERASRVGTEEDDDIALVLGSGEYGSQLPLRGPRGETRLRGQGNQGRVQEPRAQVPPGQVRERLRAPKDPGQAKVPRNSGSFRDLG